MVIEYNSFINMFVTVAIFAVLIAIALFIYEILKKEREFQEKEKETFGKYDLVLKKASKHAKSILYSTTLAAGNILADTHQTNEKIEENLDHVLQDVAARDIHSVKEVTSKYEEQYKKHLLAVQENMEEASIDAVQSLKTDYKEQVDKFTEDLLQNKLTIQSEVDKKTSELMAKAGLEIEEYKKNKFGKIDRDAEVLLKKVYREVLRTSLPQNIHQDLILKALEDAKKDGILNNL